MRREGLRRYFQSLQRFGFWFSERCMVRRGFGIGSVLFFF